MRKWHLNKSAATFCVIWHGLAETETGFSADKQVPYLNGSHCLTLYLTYVCVCVLASLQLPGTESWGRTSRHRALPDTGSSFGEGEGEGGLGFKRVGVRGGEKLRCLFLFLLSHHSVLPLKALVMHSSSSATNRVIQFPRQATLCEISFVTLGLVIKPLSLTHVLFVYCFV